MTKHEQYAKHNLTLAFNYIIGGYYNVIMDNEDCLPSNLLEVVDEIYKSTLTDTYDIGSTVYYSRPIKEIRFVGKEFILNELKHLFLSDGDSIEIVEKIYNKDFSKEEYSNLVKNTIDAYLNISIEKNGDKLKDMHHF